MKASASERARTVRRKAAIGRIRAHRRPKAAEAEPWFAGMRPGELLRWKDATPGTGVWTVREHRGNEIDIYFPATGLTLIVTRKMSVAWEPG